MKRWAIALGCAAVAAIALWLTFFRASEEDKVRAVIVDLAKIVAVKDGDNIISRTARLRSRLGDVVAEDVRVSVPELGVDVVGRTKLEDHAARAGLVYQSADCEIVTSKIKVDEGATIATVDATALVTASRGGERKVDKRDVHFLLHKDGAWKISTIEVGARRD